jgi:murein DD-endopeptidase MepM/ murein hydrolase activator NlpD
MRVTLAVCCAVSLGLAAPSAASAQAPSGGAGAPPTPAPSAVECVALPENPCRPPGALLRGREFVVRGSRLQRVTEIVFRGRRGRSDDVEVHPETASERSVVAAVPDEARSGRLTLRDRYGNGATTEQRIRVASAPAPAPVDIAPASRFFFDARRKPTFTVDAPQAMTVEVQLTNADTGELVRSWSVQAAPGAPSQVVWDGRGAAGVAAAGNYAFRLGGAASGATAETAGAETSFAYADHLFPIRGRHNLGYTDTNNFGGGRGHKGQDMFARCGTRLAAARGGRVKYAGFHSAAGYYTVIDGAETGTDYVYMHMLAPPLVQTGQRVFTGQKIGEVGETGRATGCHLHFEMWSAPGWYNGGKALDPLPSLQLWDSYS